MTTIDGYHVVNGRWCCIRTGRPLAESDAVHLCVNGRLVLAVNPVTRETTAMPQRFLARNIKGLDVTFTPSVASCLHAMSPEGKH